MMHRGEIVCADGVWLVCIADLDIEPHWRIPLGDAPSVPQINAAWTYHLQQEKEDRDG